MRNLYLLVLLLSACGEAPVLDDAGLLPDAAQLELDSGADPQDAGGSDAGLLPDAAQPVDARVVFPPPPGGCRPHVDGPDHVSHRDCPLSLPVCDAITKRCVAPPTRVCGACSSQAQCDEGAPGSECVFLLGVEVDGEIFNSDSACLWPCSSGCAWLEAEWGRRVVCARGYCLPDFSEPNCRDTTGGRL